MSGGRKIVGGATPLLDVPGLLNYYVAPKGPDAAKLLSDAKTMKPSVLIIRCLKQKYMNPTLSKIYVLRAGTGAGKSSSFVNALFEDAPGQCVYITQPKVVLCKEKMTDLPLFQKKLKKGKNLGYVVGNNQ